MDRLRVLLEGVAGHHDSALRAAPASHAFSLATQPKGSAPPRRRASGAAVDVVVIGGAVCDVAAKSDESLRDTLHTSQTGSAWLKDGGVGRNIAEGCARLGLSCAMVTSVAADARGDALVRRLKESGVDVDAVLHASAQGVGTATYQCILDKHGGLIAAVADMRVFDLLTPEVLRALPPRSPTVVCLDANVSEAAMGVALRQYPPAALALFEPTSVPKSARVVRHLDRVDIVTPNDLELFAMCEALSSQDSGVNIRGGGFATVDAAARFLLGHSAVLAVVVTLGPDGVGVYLAPRPAEDAAPQKLAKWRRLVAGVGSAAATPEAEERARAAAEGGAYVGVPAAPVEDIVDVTGAGDSLVAGICAGLCRGMSLVDSVGVVGVRAARSTLMSSESVSKTLFRDTFAS